MSDRTVTRTLEADVEPDPVLHILANPARIPEWAPVFADTVERDGDMRWLVTKNGAPFAIALAVAPAARTVDYLRETAPGRVGGAYIRVLPRPGAGSVLVMTVPVPPGKTAESVGTLLEQELQTLVNLAASSSGVSKQTE